MKPMPLDDVDALDHARNEIALLANLVGNLDDLRLNERETYGLNHLLDRWQETLSHALEAMRPEEEAEDQPGRA